jgi:hypothetical protein
MEYRRHYTDDVERGIRCKLMHRRPKFLMRNIAQVNLKTNIKYMPENENKRQNLSNAL